MTLGASPAKTRDGSVEEERGRGGGQGHRARNSRQIKRLNKCQQKAQIQSSHMEQEAHKGKNEG